MNLEIFELWGRWLQATIQGQRQINSMSQWWEHGLEAFGRLNPFFSQTWAIPAAQQPMTALLNGWQQTWMPILQLQQRALQWMGMVPPHHFQELSKKVAALEEQVRSQAYFIERLQGQLNRREPEPNETSQQFQALIEQQSRQFQQLTTSIGQFIQERAGSSTSEDGGE